MKRSVVVLLFGSVVAVASACGGSGDSGGSGGGTGAKSGAGGSSAAAGADGSAATGGGGTGATGSTGGTGGAGGTAAAGGAAGAGGTSGAAGATGGAAGATGGAAGAGTGGAAGSDAGNDGSAGTGGTQLACTYCHGSANPAPPKDLGGSYNPQVPGVGAHQSHLASSTWHKQVTCAECHTVPSQPIDPAVPTHQNGTTDIVWGSLAKQGSYDFTANTCTNTYCHGGTLKPDAAGQASNRTPLWTQLDGSQKACGTSCHTLPPGGSHPGTNACPSCHGEVITSFDPTNPSTATWKDSNKHVDGTVQVISNLNCTSCHGNAANGDPMPPLGTKGETLPSQAAVGAHAQHVGTASWHRAGQCSDCHVLPTSTGHSNGQVDFTWSGPANADNANPAFDATQVSCSGVYCHGTTLKGPVTGGTVSRTPVWNIVNGSYDSCGNTCHTNPPGDGHPNMTTCPTCHGAVISGYTPGNPPTATWADANKHVDGIVEVANLTCTSCHGSSATSDPAPPLGVDGETLTSTLAVGRHAAHLTSSSTHLAFACGTCHSVPAAGDLTHTTGYIASTSLASAGHHGDVTFSAPGTGMSFNVNATQGTPVTARGTCTGACHSNGRGGPPLVTPYWAGGAWTVGSCSSCHAGTLGSLPERHGTHSGEATCATCHPGASTGTHMNGSWDVFGTISGGAGGGSVNTTGPGGPCGQNFTCNGTCHGKLHTNFCWAP